MKTSILLVLMSLFCRAQVGQSADSLKKLIDKKFEDLDHRLDQLAKAVDDVQWYNKVGDVAVMEKVFIVGPPPIKVKDSTARGALNPVKFWAYVFIPKTLDREKKYPLLVLPHGGVHGDFTTYHTHIIREMMAQGYVVIAPEYRGSTGYGKSFYERIDYGGREVEDNHAARNWMVENYSFVDSTRIGAVGWSHGGFITLLDIFEHPDDYQAAFAGVPVSDLVMRLGYYGDDYRKEFYAPYHIGKSVSEDSSEYLKRSPANHAYRLFTPLLIHTNTSDDDVHVEEVTHLIEELRKAGKKFEYEIFQDAPGGHSFDRIDTRLAKQIRLKIYKFLAQYLAPPHPFQTLADLEKAGYR
ncbi:MAG: S9 family peptidase [Ignavibacteriae bacterium]|nr:MAG: S9 family peptidase [Ignavibacteriota bacterium]